MASGDLQAHPGMLALARESRGMTQVDVAAAMTKAAPAGAAVVSRDMSAARNRDALWSPTTVFSCMPPPWATR